MRINRCLDGIVRTIGEQHPEIKKGQVSEYVAALAQVCGAMKSDLKVPGHALRRRLRALGREKRMQPEVTRAAAGAQERIQARTQHVSKEGQSEWKIAGVRGPRWKQKIQLPVSSENSPTAAVDKAFYKLEKKLIESLPTKP